MTRVEVNVKYQVSCSRPFGPMCQGCSYLSKCDDGKKVAGGYSPDHDTLGKWNKD